MANYTQLENYKLPYNYGIITLIWENVFSDINN